ncbi:hypothetical protein FRC12_013722 [Ceratobasidium sp. 428]|nr:hypothetical protein FRC12_013722 [Ceratobasidium sp. 428]
MEVDDVPVPTAAPADFMPDDDDPWFGKQTWLPAEDRLSEIQSDERQRFERFYPGFQRPLMARPRGMMLLPRMADIGFSGNFMGRDDRSRSSRNLVSRILDDTVRIVSRASGVAIYCCAVWDDMEQGTEAYEFVS